MAPDCLPGPSDNVAQISEVQDLAAAQRLSGLLNHSLLVVSPRVPRAVVDFSLGWHGWGSCLMRYDRCTMRLFLSSISGVSSSWQVCRVGAIASLCMGLLVGCASSSSSGIELSVSRGDATGSYAGTYIGTLSLTSTADVVAIGSATDQRIEPISVEVTADGRVFVEVHGVRNFGVVDNAGNWGLQASINDLRSLISDTNINRLHDAGCPLGAKAARIQGVISPPDLSADANGQLKCKRAEVTVATLVTAGTLTASSQ